MDFRTVTLTEEDVRAIREVASLKDEDYMNVQSNGTELIFSKINNTSFKSYVIYTESTGLFNLRVASSLIASFLVDGVLGISLGDNINLAIASTPFDFDNELFKRVVTFDRQDGRDTLTSKMLGLAKTLTAKNGYTVYNPATLGMMNSLSKIDSKGVLFKDGYVFTEGAGFKAFYRTDQMHLQMAVGVEALDLVGRLAKRLSDGEYLTLWDVDNYLFLKDGKLTHAFKKSRADIPMGIEALDNMTPIETIVIDITDMVQQLKGIRITKASNFKTEYDMSSFYFTLTDPGRFVSRTLIPLERVINEVLRFDTGILKSTLTALYDKTNQTVTMVVYENVIVFQTVLGIHLIIGRE